VIGPLAALWERANGRDASSDHGEIESGDA
jgi:hypothetical protein